MADISLERPEQGRQVHVDTPENARLVPGFPTDAATMERAGDDLVFTFDDGGSIVLDDFCASHSRENLPDFQVDGETVAGSDFFAALSEDLQPAAGPAAAARASGGRYHEFNDMSLLDGIDRLDGLDLGFSGEAQPQNDLYGLGGDTGGSTPTADATAPDGVAPAPEPVPPVPPTPPLPDIDVDKEGNFVIEAPSGATILDWDNRLKPVPDARNPTGLIFDPNGTVDGNTSLEFTLLFTTPEGGLHRPDD